MDCGPNHELIPVVRLPICIRNRLFLQRGEIAGSIAHRPPPKWFPEGELLAMTECPFKKSWGEMLCSGGWWNVRCHGKGT